MRSRLKDVWRWMEARQAVALARRAGRQLHRYWFDGAGDEKAFLPAALEIIERPASPLARGTGFVIVAFCLVALLWASLGAVDVVAIAPGRVVASGHTKLVQPLEAGVVRAIRVQDGQQVKAGDVLLEIDATINEAEEGRVAKELAQVRLDVARLQAASVPEGDVEAAFVPPDGADAGQVRIARALLVHQTGEFRAKLDALGRQMEQTEANRAAVEATIAKIEAALPMLKERERLRGYLSDKGYGSRFESISARQDRVEHEKEREVQRSRLVEAHSGLAALQAQRQQAAAEYHRGVTADLAEAQRKASALGEQLVQARQRARLQTLRAPVDGTVQQLAVHTEGGVVTPAQVLLAVVPLGSRVEVEAYVPNRDIGFVRAGQVAAIKVDTFNFTRYGMLNGTITSVSQDAVSRDAGPPRSQEAEQQKKQEGAAAAPAGEMAYLARIALERSSMDIDGRLVSLSPGMAVTAEVRTGRRRVIEYLLSPLMRRQQQALRER